MLKKLLSVPIIAVRNFLATGVKKVVSAEKFQKRVIDKSVGFFMTWLFFGLLIMSALFANGVLTRHCGTIVIFWLLGVYGLATFMFNPGAFGLEVIKISASTMLTNINYSKILQVFPDECFYWREDYDKFDPGGKYTHSLSYTPWNAKISLEVHPITPNPKVRDLKLEVNFRIGGTPERALLVQQQFGHNKETPAKVVGKLLYDLIELKSPRFGEFSNPLSDAQQKQFSQLIREEIEPQLNMEGLTFLNASFTLGTFGFKVSEKELANN